QLIADAGVLGLLAEHPAVPAERPLEILELILVKAGDVAADDQALAGIGADLELDLVDADQPGPLLATDVDRLEEPGGLGGQPRLLEVALEGGARLERAGRVLQGRRVRLEGSLGIADVALVELAELEVELDGLGHREGEAEPPLGQ